MTLAVETDAGEVSGSGAAGFVAESSCLGASAIAAAAATGATDFPDPVTRFVRGFADDFFDGSATARGVTTVDAAASAALGTGAGAIGGVLGVTSRAASRRSGCPSEPAARGAADRRGNATAATTSTAAATMMTARSRVARSKGAGVPVEGGPTDGAGSIEGATGTRAFSASSFARRRFLAVFFTRAPLFGPTSANTSNVQRMLRPARSGRIRFAMSTEHRNARAGRFPAEFRDREPGRYKSVIGLSSLPVGAAVARF
jgi:hypothetical protein